MVLDGGYVEELLAKADISEENIQRILNKAEQFEGLKHEEVAALLQTKDSKHIERIFQIAGKIKQHIYGNRIVMFAPLYVSDYCVNRCKYCGYNQENSFKRRRLTMEEIREELVILERMGHKRIALEAGEDPENCSIDYILDCLQTIYEMKMENGEIRRANVNIAATTVENYRKLKDGNIGTYILFQETYHQTTYETMHMKGPKHNYQYHLDAFDRAMEAGIEDVGGGVLFGLYDARFEVLGLMLHNEHLEATFGTGFHTVSIPRLRAADGVDPSIGICPIDDETFKRITAIIRLAMPYTGMILSTREDIQMRSTLLKIGISQISAGSTVEVGGYSLRADNSAQFEVADHRPAGEIISWLMKEGYIPSFCTACYRTGRTGDRFMALAKSGNIKNVCQPNALMTLCEYMLDYGNEEFRRNAEVLIEKEVNQIPNLLIREQVKARLIQLKQGKRDLFI